MSRQLDNTATENPSLGPMNLRRYLNRLADRQILCRLLARSSSFSFSKHRLPPASLFIGFIALFTSQLPAAQPNTAPPIPSLSAEDILRRALDARGGAVAAAQIRSFRASGIADFAGGGRCDYEFIGARPNKTREYFAAGGDRYESAFDGESAWESRPHAPPEAPSGDKLYVFQDEASFFAWYDDPHSYRSVTYAGETSFEGTKCYQLKVITISGHEQTHYYNTSNYLLLATVEGIATDAGPETCITFFQKYGKFAGFLFPTRLRCRTDENEWVIRINSVQTIHADDSAFGMPKALAPQAATNAATLSDAEIKTALNDSIDGDKLGVGLVVGLLDSQGSRVISYGKVDNASTNQDVNGDTLFEIGSITKVFTRLLLYDMISREEMHMDDPVQNYLPASVRMPTRHNKQITLWDLVTHTSGLPREMNRPYKVDQLYAFLSSHKLRREPGEQFEYSNIGVALLGHVIALKAGQDYETLVRERICRPLHMDSTAITLTPELQARRAVGHAPASKSVSYIGLQGLPGSGALFSTANDMLKLASAKLGFTPCDQAPNVKRAVGHNGGTYGFSTMLAFESKPRRALVMLSNCRDDDLMGHFYALLKNQSPKPPHSGPLSPDSCDNFVGQYYAKDARIIAVRRDGDRLLLQEFGKPSCELFPLSQTNFYNQLFDCRASFVGKDNKGNARELLLGDASNPSWRGTRIPGQVLQPSPTLTKNDCLPRKDSDLQGIWTATLRPWYWPFYAVHVKVRIAEPSPRAFRAELDSPDLGAENLPLAVIYDPPHVNVFGFSGEGSFEGAVNSSHTKVSGHWNVAGHTIGVTFRRAKL